MVRLSFAPQPAFLRQRLRDLNRPAQLGVVALILIIMSLFLYGAVMQAAFVNQGGTDQGAYSGYTRALYDDPTYIDGARMPLFSMIVRLFYDPDMSSPALFALGKAVGIGVSLIGLTATALIFYHFFPVLLATVLLLIATFTMFVFKAPYYQTETLFYSLSFVAFVLILKGFQGMTPPLAVGIGLALGLTMLAKASAITTLTLFTGLATTQVVWTSFQKRLPLLHPSVLRSLGSIALVSIVFLLLLSTYIASSRRIFGPPFYNVNTTFYMWYDSWEEARAGTRAHGDRVGWPDMPEEQLPSLSRYLAEHRPREMFYRVVDGLNVQYLKHCTLAFDYNYGYCPYLAAFGVASAAIIVTNLPLMLALLRRHLFLITFCVATFAIHVVLTGWWTPISPGRRFMLAMFLPLLFALGSVFSVPRARVLTLTLGRYPLDLRNIFLIGILIALVYETYLAVTDRVLWLYGGD